MKRAFQRFVKQATNFLSSACTLILFPSLAVSCVIFLGNTLVTLRSYLNTRKTFVLLAIIL
jgi:hypothetical protein